jgi:exodeoxyribonuclease V gamma subunit
VVCLLGMDDTRFPRSSRTDGDDLLLGDERVGDFDRSSEDRQLLLDALMAAGDHLVVTYAGRDQLTNAALPPAVPIAELYDTLRDMVGDDGVAAIETVHPLQSFSEANFIPGALDLPGPFGFDPVALAGAEALVGGLAAVPGPAPDWPDPEPVEGVDLDDLIRFLQHPVQHFMRTRMGMSVPKIGEIPDDTLAADLNSLEAWQVKEDLLDGLADGYHLDELTDRKRADDALPPGALGIDDIDKAAEAATALWQAATERGYDRQRMRPYRGTVAAGGASVEGVVSADPDAAHLFTVTSSRLKGKHRLKAFVELAFLSALEPDIAWSSQLLGRDPERGGHLAVTFGPMRGTAAERRVAAGELLAGLVALYVEGQEHPLPVPCETTFRWQRGRAKSESSARWAATEAWEKDRFSPEVGDPAHTMLLEAVSIDDLLAAGLEDFCSRLWSPAFPLMGEKKL